METERREHEPTFQVLEARWWPCERSRVFSTTAKGLLLIAAALFGASDLFGPILTLIPAVVIGIGALVLVAASYILSVAGVRARGEWLREPARLELLTRGGARIVTENDVAGALVAMRSEDGRIYPVVEVALWERFRSIPGGRRRLGDELSVRMSAEGDARALVAALGFGPRGRRTTIRLAVRRRRFFNVALAAGSLFVAAAVYGLVDRTHVVSYALVGVHGPLAAALMALGIYESAKAVFRPGAVAVGRDGIEVSRGWRRVFIARPEVAVLEVDAGTIRTKAGSRVHVGPKLFDRERLLALAGVFRDEAPARVKQARYAAYMQKGHSVAEWREHLLRSVVGADYRHDASPLEEAMDIVMTPEATPEQRIGAALAVRIAGGAGDQLRVASERIADERIRVAISLIAEEEDEQRVENAVRRALRDR